MIDRLEDLKLFTRIVEAGSLSAAARSLSLTQPTVSKRLMAIEEQLGVRLVQRSTRRIRLTDEGRSWYEACRKWVSEMDEVAGRLRGNGAGVSGKVRLNAPVALGRTMLLPLVLRYLGLHPEATVDLTLDNRRVDLVEDEVDLAIRIGTIGNPDVVAKKLFSYRTFLVASPTYLSKRGRPRTAQELLSHTLVAYGAPAGPEEVEDPSGRVRLSPNAQLRTNDSTVFITAMLEGVGIGLTAPWNVVPSIATGGLERLLPQALGPRYPVHLLYLPARAMPERVRVLASFLTKELPRRVAELPGVEL